MDPRSGGSVCCFFMPVTFISSLYLFLTYTEIQCQSCHTAPHYLFDDSGRTVSSDLIFLLMPLSLALPPLPRSSAALDEVF